MNDQEDPVIRTRADFGVGLTPSRSPNVTLPPQHRIWERLIDMVQYTLFLVVALFAAIYKIEEKSFWIAYTVIVVGVLTRSRTGKIDPDLIMRLVGR